MKIAALRANGFVCEPRAEQCRANPYKPESDYYARQLFDARFTAAPRGAGQQTHRCWEALLAGSIPLIDYDPRLDKLFDGLPVVLVTDWSQVTRSFLEQTWKNMNYREWDWSKLYFPFWLDQLGIHARIK